MKEFRLSALVMAACTLVACDQPAPTQALAINTAALTNETHDASTGAIVVRGEVSTPSGAGRRVVTIDAMQNPSGKVSGTYRIDFTATGVFFVVKVSCISAIGNTAFIGGHFVESNSAAIQIGSVSYFFVTDNGKPDPVHPFVADEISTARINDRLGQDEEFCELQPLLLTKLTGLEGDISVR
jgi:hypothetical protein